MGKQKMKRKKMRESSESWRGEWESQLIKQLIKYSRVISKTSCIAFISEKVETRAKPSKVTNR